MAALDELISKIQDDDLRGLIKAEFDKLRKRKKFGLVFESANEFSPLFGLPVKVGALVAKKNGGLKEIFKVTALDGDIVTCTDGKESFAFDRADLIVVNRLGDSICPALSKIDDVANAPDSDLWHVLIEAENFHALQLLRYLYAGKVDCIYIDPPYNTGARDWKYNNDYVDANDNYRHSKWLAMMERRLALVKELLNPNDSVLIVTIDEKEYLHLGCLLEEMFHGARIQMISSVINPKGVSNTKGFRRADEYLFFIMIGNASPCLLPLGNEWSPSAIRSAIQESDDDKKSHEPGWTSMMRRGTGASRTKSPNLYYAIYADPKTRKIVKIGNVIPFGKSRDDEIDGLIQILPLRTNGGEGRWQVGIEELKRRIEQGRIRLGKETRYGFTVNYLPDGEYQKILDGGYKVIGRKADGSLVAKSISGKADNWIAPTQWKIASHDASAYGSALLTNIFGGGRFAFPKSLYAVRDALKFFVANKPDALILDFFAGSGTTLHAVNLLNAEDGGRRRCILVTNNEVSEAEAKRLTAAGLTPADDAWQELGIARHVTWQRTVCSIEGHDINGAPLKGTYLGTERAMADGFAANAIFFKMTSLDKDAVAAGDCFKELLAVLWLKAGGVGKCPTLETETLPPYKIFAENKFAVLLDERHFGDFAEAVGHAAIETVFIVTGSNAALNRMRALLGVPKAYRLYGDYLKNIRLKEARR